MLGKHEPVKSEPGKTDPVKDKPVILGAIKQILIEQNMNEDAKFPGRGESLENIEKSKASGITYDLITNLWSDERNKNVVEAFVANPLWTELVRSSDGDIEENKNNLGTRMFEYLIQDYFYLLDQVKFKALRLTTIPFNQTDDLERTAASVKSAAAYAKRFLFSLAMFPQIPTSENYKDPSEKQPEPKKDDVQANKAWIDIVKKQEETQKVLDGNTGHVQKVDRSVAELAYSNYLQVNATRNDWFELHVFTAACIYGWSRLAWILYNDREAKRDTWFWKSFIEANLAIEKGTEYKRINNFNSSVDVPQKGDKVQFSSSAQKLSAFLDANKKSWSTDDAMATLNQVFRTGLRLELALTKSGDSPYGKGPLDVRQLIRPKLI